MKSRSDSQRSLPPMEVQNVSSPAEARNKVSSPEPDAPDQAEADASRLFDEALSAAGITSKEVESLCGVSKSLVSRWRSPHYRDVPSFSQMLRLPIQFHLELHRVMNRRYGYGKAALKRILDDLGIVALAVSE